MVQQRNTVTLQPDPHSVLAATMLAFCLVFVASCASEVRPPEPSIPAEEENLLASFLEDGVPSEFVFFSTPEDGYRIERVEGHTGELAIEINGEGRFGGVNVGRVRMEGHLTYIASAFVECKVGESVLKLDYYQGERLVGNTSSLPALKNGWQHVTVLSQRSLYPRATHVKVVAICRGEVHTRFDDFALVAYPTQL